MLSPDYPLGGFSPPSTVVAINRPQNVLPIDPLARFVVYAYRSISFRVGRPPLGG